MSEGSNLGIPPWLAQIARLGGGDRTGFSNTAGAVPGANVSVPGVSGGGVPTGQTTQAGDTGGPQAAIQAIMRQMAQRRLAQPEARPTGEREPMAYGTRYGTKNEELALAFRNIGAFVHNAVVSHKEKQVKEATGNWMVLTQAWNQALEQANGDQQKATQIYQANPTVQGILGNPKILKQIYKALNVDLLNPGKSQVYLEGMQRAAQITQAGQGVKDAQQKMKDFKQRWERGQLTPEEQQRLTAESASKLPMVSQQPTFSEALSFVREMRETAMQKEQLAERRQEHLDNIQLRKDTLEQNIQMAKDRLAEKKTSDEDRLALQKQIAGWRHEEVLARMDEKATRAVEKSKIPPTLVSRVTQAQTIKEQIEDLREQMKDPGLRRYMGPMAGLAAPVTRLYSGKVQEFNAAQESLDALLPILHAYRGGSQMHQVFKKSMGTMTMTPEAYEGTLRALDKLADNIVTEVKKEYPSDPLWGEDAKKEAKPEKIVVSPEDMK